MVDDCCSSTDLPANNQPLGLSAKICPSCGRRGKPVQGQTVKAQLSTSLRQVEEVSYFFCKTQSCPVVYFSPGGPSFTVNQVRERVYQQAPDNDEVLVCYCFQHKVGDIRTGSVQSRQAVIEDVNAGISAGQCACDVRNPQGSCCLGNVRAMIASLNSA